MQNKLSCSMMQRPSDKSRQINAERLFFSVNSLQFARSCVLPSDKPRSRPLWTSYQLRASRLDQMQPNLLALSVQKFHLHGINCRAFKRNQLAAMVVAWFFNVAQSSVGPRLESFRGRVVMVKRCRDSCGRHSCMRKKVEPRLPG